MFLDHEGWDDTRQTEKEKRGRQEHFWWNFDDDLCIIQQAFGWKDRGSWRIGSIRCRSMNERVQTL